jgi:hypothetical protein
MEEKVAAVEAAVKRVMETQRHARFHSAHHASSLGDVVSDERFVRAVMTMCQVLDTCRKDADYTKHKASATQSIQEYDAATDELCVAVQGLFEATESFDDMETYLGHLGSVSQETRMSSTSAKITFKPTETDAVVATASPKKRRRIDAFDGTTQPKCAKIAVRTAETSTGITKAKAVKVGTEVTNDWVSRSLLPAIAGMWRRDGIPTDAELKDEDYDCDAPLMTTRVFERGIAARLAEFTTKLANPSEAKIKPPETNDVVALIDGWSPQALVGKIAKAAQASRDALDAQLPAGAGRVTT